MFHNFRKFLSKYRLPLGIAFLLLASAGIFFAIRSWSRPSPAGEPVPVGVGATTGTEGGIVQETEASRLSVQLSEGKPQPQALETPPVATGEPLSGEQIDAILARLPGLPGRARDEVGPERPCL